MVIFCHKHKRIACEVILTNVNNVCFHAWRNKNKYCIYPKYSDTLTPYHTCSKI